MPSVGSPIKSFLEAIGHVPLKLQLCELISTCSIYITCTCYSCTIAGVVYGVHTSGSVYIGHDGAARVVYVN